MAEEAVAASEKDKFVLRDDSTVARLDIVLLLPRTAHCACVSEISLKRKFTTSIAGFT